jgi:hypothetical protein
MTFRISTSSQRFSNVQLMMVHHVAGRNRVWSGRFLAETANSGLNAPFSEINEGSEVLIGIST